MSLPYGLGSNAALVVGSEKILDDMLLAMNGTFAGPNAIAPCDRSTLPPLVLIISGEKYRMPPEKFTTRLDDRHCSINVEVAPNSWNAFIQEYCLVVDYDDQRLGFAKNMIDLPL